MHEAAVSEQDRLQQYIEMEKMITNASADQSH